MNNQFICLIIIFTLLILLITFGDGISPSGWISFFSTGSNSISKKSIVDTIKI